MDHEAKMKWFSPDRIMKLYVGERSPFGTRRLFVVGIGANGIDCLVKCKDIAENKFSADSSKLRYLGIGLKDDLDRACAGGSALCENERLEIDPEAAIYPYLNDPELLPEAAKAWFDDGLRNYTPAKPVYGLSKRQCARVALFHYFGSVLKLLGDAVNSFAKDASPIEIAFTGNLGDAFFGGMVIDLAYITRIVFTKAKLPVTVNAYMLAGDTALLQGMDGRALAIFYANTIVAKSELDKFQYQKRKYSQKFAENYVFSSGKPPFQCCTINAAESTYEATIENLAYKITAGAAVVFKQDDEGEKRLSYNMFDEADKPGFRYICSGIAAEELPVGKIMSFITLKLVAANYTYLVRKTAGEAEIGIISSKAATNDLFLAQKAGELPKFEYDETLNPLFSIKSLKNGTGASKKYVTDRLEIIAKLCKDGAEIYLNEIFGEIRDICEQARYDNEKGPYYAAEIVRKCLSELKSASAETKNALGSIDNVISEEDRRLSVEYRAIHGTFGFFGSKSNAAYIDQIKKYADVKRRELTSGILLDYYDRLSEKLNVYLDELSQMTDLFSAAIDQFHNMTELMKPSDDGFVRDAFDASKDSVLEKLNKMVESLPETTISFIFKRSNILKEAMSGDDAAFARCAVGYTETCFHKIFEMGFDEFCRELGVGADAARSIGNCLEKLCVNTPSEEGTPLVRVLCPRYLEIGSMAGLHAAHSSASNIWSSSVLLHTIVTEQVRAVKLDQFKDYKQWENMRYAYVNDSLKKHGIHIFK